MRSYWLAWLIAVLFVIPALAQPPLPTEPDTITDPTAPSPQIRDTIGAIRRKNEIDDLLRELEQLRRENEDLRQQLAQQSTAIPLVVLKARIVGEQQTLAVLDIGEKTTLVRPGMQVLIPIGQNQATPMLVKEISADAVELEFTELDRTILLFE